MYTVQFVRSPDQREEKVSFFLWKGRSHSSNVLHWPFDLIVLLEYIGNRSHQNCFYGQITSNCLDVCISWEGNGKPPSITLTKKLLWQHRTRVQAEQRNTKANVDLDVTLKMLGAYTPLKISPTY